MGVASDNEVRTDYSSRGKVSYVLSPMISIEVHVDNISEVYRNCSKWRSDVVLQRPVGSYTYIP